MKLQSLLVVAGVGLVLVLTPELAVGTAQGEAENAVRVPHSFEAGSAALASEVNANFLALEEGVNANGSMVTAVDQRTLALETAIEAGDELIEDLDQTVANIGANVDAVSNSVQDLQAAFVPVGKSDHLITVAQEGADHTTVADALAQAALDTTITVVRVLPGTYDEVAELIVPGHVHLQGASSSATLVRASRSGNLGDGATLILEEGARVSSMAVQNLGTGSDFSTAIFAQGTTAATLLEDVRTLGNQIGGTKHRALLLAGAAMTVRRTELEARGAADDSVAIQVNNDGSSAGSIRVEDSILIAGGATIQAFAANLEITTSHVSTGADEVAQLTGGATALFAATQLEGGEATALGNSVAKFVRCWKSNFDPIADGVGSTIEP